MRFYAQAIDIYPKFAPAYNNIGHVFGKRDNVQEAMLNYQEAARLSLFEKDYETYLSSCNNIGCLIRAGDEKALKKTYQVNDYDWGIDTCIHDCGDVPSVFGLNTSFVFCNFNTINKMEPLSFDSWMRILSRVPGSILWLLEPSALDIGVMNIFRLEAASRGIDPRRLVFAPRVSKREHLERLRHAHLFLDSFIYNAHSTASNMIWANLPLLTLQGDTFASRVAASLIQASLGPNVASVLVAHSMKEYEEIAVALATTHRAKL